MIRVLFVCTGNICRSPTAEGVLRHLARARGLEGRVEAASAGTIAYHAGEAPDPRARAAAARRGIDLSGIRARRVRAEDFARFDHILAMDTENLDDLRRACPPAHAGKVRLLLDHAPGLEGAEVPDPYYGGADGFERVLDLCAAAAGGLLDRLEDREAGR